MSRTSSTSLLSCTVASVVSKPSTSLQSSHWTYLVSNASGVSQLFTASFILFRWGVAGTFAAGTATRAAAELCSQCFHLGCKSLYLTLQSLKLLLSDTFGNLIGRSYRNLALSDSYAVFLSDVVHGTVITFYKYLFHGSHD